MFYAYINVGRKKYYFAGKSFDTDYSNAVKSSDISKLSRRINALKLPEDYRVIYAEKRKSSKSITKKNSRVKRSVSKSRKKK